MENTKHVLIVLLVFTLGAVFGGVALTVGGVWRAGAIGYFLGAVSVFVFGLWAANRTPKEGGD